MILPLAGLMERRKVGRMACLPVWLKRTNNASLRIRKQMKTELAQF
jgi:hypothetical protein